MSTDRLPPLNALRAFLLAARHQSFVQAANALSVTPAAVSQQIRQLEAATGCVLFERRARGLRLTEAGRAALPELERGFAHLARGVADMRCGSIAGPLTVSTLPSFAVRWLLPRLPAFLAARPEIDLTVRPELRRVDFARDPVDLAVRYGTGGFVGLESRLLMTEEVFPVCAPSLLNGPRPLSRLADLRHHTLLHDRQISGNEPSLGWRAWLAGTDLEDLDPDRGPGFTDATMLMAAAALGMGVALGRSALVLDDLAAGRLVRPFVATRPAEYGYYLVMPPGRDRQPRIRTFVEWIVDEAAAPLARDFGGVGTVAAGRPREVGGLLAGQPSLPAPVSPEESYDAVAGKNEAESAPLASRTDPRHDAP